MHPDHKFTIEMNYQVLERPGGNLNITNKKKSMWKPIIVHNSDIKTFWQGKISHGFQNAGGRKERTGRKQNFSDCDVGMADIHHAMFV